jgi:hypothetical protein
MSLFGTSQAAVGCGGCAVKSNGNCTSHLTTAAAIIAKCFVDAKMTFNRADPDHMAAIRDILREDMRDEKQNHVAYEVPQDPQLKEFFFTLISSNIKNGAPTR